MELTISLNKIQISLGLNIVGNIWENVSTQLNKIHNKGLVVFRHYQEEMLHTVLYL